MGSLLPVLIDMSFVLLEPNRPDHTMTQVVGTHDASNPIKEGLGKPLLTCDVSVVFIIFVDEEKHCPFASFSRSPQYSGIAYIVDRPTTSCASCCTGPGARTLTRMVLSVAVRHAELAF